ncbi:hypothetical protein [Butyrivibrio sp. JL13D10]|uniref:hypothetical protein n=1 Tax=Butyrivibrio sp. JL13D10 TaxID=3236815 RepID=UPI0038B66977
MVVELNDTSKVKDLFTDWEETLIYSCLQKVMGKIYVTLMTRGIKEKLDGFDS